MSARLFLVMAFASVVSASLPWFIEVGDTNCTAVAEAADVKRVLVGCANGVHAVDVERKEVVQKNAFMKEVMAMAVDSARHYAYLLQATNLTVVETTNISTEVATLDLSPVFQGGGIVQGASYNSARRFLYVTTTRGVVVINVQSVLNPAWFLFRLALLSGAYQSSTQVFAGGVQGGVAMYDVSNPFNQVVFIGNQSIPGVVSDVGLAGNSLAVCMVGTEKPLWIYDITIAPSPVLDANVETDFCGEVVTDGKNKVIVVDQGGAEWLDVSGDSVRVVKTFTGNLGSISAALSEDGNTLYTGCLEKGLGLYNVTN